MVSILLVFFVYLIHFELKFSECYRNRLDGYNTKTARIEPARALHCPSKTEIMSNMAGIIRRSSSAPTKTNI